MIYFLRHGADDERFIGGWSDVGLIYKGKEQVKDAISFLKEHPIHFDKIYSSDILRAQETAEMVQAEFLVPITFDSRLREQNKGDFNGVFATKAKLEHPNFFPTVTIDTIYPNGESLEEFQERIKQDLPYFLEQDHSLIVTHRGVINTLYYEQDHIPLDMNKEQFGVCHASIHEYNPKTKRIHKIY